MPNRKDKVLYIESMLWELHKMAHAENLHMLCHFLAMSAIEAEQTHRNEVMMRYGAQDILPGT